MARILIADDDPTTLSLLTEVLTTLGHQVQTADDGLAALALLVVQPFDLLISDMDMPHLSGAALVQVVVEQPNAPCIFVCSAGNVDAVTAKLVNRVFTKPVGLRGLANAITALRIAESTALVRSA